MIRLINDMNGFSYFNTSNVDAIGISDFPNQYNEHINTYTTIRYRNTKLFKTFERFKIQKKYANYNPVIMEDYPEFFRIVRFDNEGPNKAILIGTGGEVLVCKASELLQFDNLYNSDFYNATKNRATKLRYKYFEPNTPIEENKLLEFFEKYNQERIWEYPIQDYDLLGRLVWIEYDKSLVDSKSIENTITETTVDGETVEVKNDFSFTSEMRSRLVAGNSKLMREPDFFLAYYPYTYNIHAQTRIDMPRRTYTKGIIIRADVQSVDPHIVVMELQDNSNTVRFICDDEARFYYDTRDKNNGTSFNAFEELSNYDVYSAWIDSQEEYVEPEEEEVTPSEEEEPSEEQEQKEIRYEDVIIHIKSEDITEESEEEEPSEEDNTESENNNEDTNLEG